MVVGEEGDIVKIDVDIVFVNVFVSGINWNCCYCLDVDI